MNFKLCGVGLAIVNAASETFEVMSDNGLNHWRYKIDQSATVTGPIKGSTTGKKGVCFRLRLNSSLFKFGPDIAVLQMEVRDVSYLHPGLRIVINGEIFHSSEGLIEYARLISDADQISKYCAREFSLIKKFQEYDLQVAILGDKATSTLSRSWVNGFETEDGGTHLDSLTSALSYVGWMPAIQLIHILMKSPRYALSTQNKLNAPELEEGLKELLIEQLFHARN